MKGKTLLFVAAAAVLGIGMMSCGKKDETTEAPAAAAGASAGKPVDATTAGSVTGTIKLDGAAPKMKVINMAAEPNCAKAHTTPPMTQDVVVGSGGALQNVVVYLKGDFSQYSFDAATTPVQIDQKGCQYQPHVLALMTAQPLQVVNSDPTTHNIHPVPKNNREWNESQPPGAAPINQSFAREEVAIPVKCNVHPWMKAYIAVFGSPYFQVTGDDGAFTLKNVPPGTYTVSAWHELYGSSEQSVTIGPKESKAVNITFKASAAGGN
jgi:Carboxypeptidase regulatory-like domain